MPSSMLGNSHVLALFDGLDQVWEKGREARYFGSTRLGEASSAASDWSDIVAFCGWAVRTCACLSV